MGEVAGLTERGVRYGDRRETVYCTTYDSYFDPISLRWYIRITKVERDIVWRVERCGGKGNDCTIGTERQWYVSGGC